MKAAENPFRASATDCVPYRFKEGSLEELSRKVLTSGPGRIWGITGPEGSGKSALLADLEEHLVKSGKRVFSMRFQDSIRREELRRLTASIRGSDDATILFIDGSELLNRWRWFHLKQLVKAYRKVMVATAHTNPGIPILYETSTSEKLAQQLVRNLMGGSRDENLERIALEAFRKKNGNMREVFRACYHRLADSGS